LTLKSLLESLANIRGHTLSTLNLGRDTIVVDAGANRGEFSRALVQRFGCTCHLVEANPALASNLRDQSSFTTVTQAALGAHDGTTTFYVRDHLEAGSLFPTKNSDQARQVDVLSMSLAKLMRHLGTERIDLLKLDIEGSEFDVILNTPDDILGKIGQMTVEFHDFLPQFDRPGLYRQAASQLAAAGFVCCPMAFRTHGDVLFLNQRWFPIRPTTARGLALTARWYMRAKRLSA
jgi:FkbM family methyltransferase